MNIEPIVYTFINDKAFWTDLEKSIFSYCEKSHTDFLMFFSVSIKFYLQALKEKETVFEKNIFPIAEYTDFKSSKKTIVKYNLSSLEQNDFEKICLENCITPYEFIYEAMQYTLKKNIDIKTYCYKKRRA